MFIIMDDETAVSPDETEGELNSSSHNQRDERNCGYGFATKCICREVLYNIPRKNFAS